MNEAGVKAHQTGRLWQWWETVVVTSWLTVLVSWSKRFHRAPVSNGFMIIITQTIKFNNPMIPLYEIRPWFWKYPPNLPEFRISLLKGPTIYGGSVFSLCSTQICLMLGDCHKYWGSPSEKDCLAVFYHVVMRVAAGEGGRIAKMSISASAVVSYQIIQSSTWFSWHPL